MRIAILVDKLNIDAGGSNRSLDLLASKLCEHGHHVSIITTNITAQNNLPESDLYDVIESNVNTTVPFKMYSDIKSLLKEHESDFDLYHVFKPLLISIAGGYRKSGGKTPVVGRLNSYSMFCTNSTLMDGSCHKNCTIFNKLRHDDVSVSSKLLRFPYYVYNNNRSIAQSNIVDRIFAQSPSVKEIYSDVGVNIEMIDVVPNFYDETFADSEEASYKQRDIDVLFVGRLEYGKGADILLEAITESKADINTHIIGEGKYRDDLEEKYSGKNIHFRGWVPHSQLQDIYTNSKYFVHPGRWPDPCPRTILEAMQSGCVPIVSDIGGPSWMVGNAGKVFESENTEELRNILKETVPSESEYNTKLSDLDNELERFAPETIIDKIESNYLELIGSR